MNKNLCNIIGNNNSNSNSGNTSANFKRKASIFASSSAVDDKIQPRSSSGAGDGDSEYNTILSVPNANTDEVLVISEEDSASAHATAPVSARGEQAVITQMSSHHASENASSMMHHESCEVDEVDFNHCFPWIRVVVGFLSSIDYACAHSSQCGSSAAAAAPTVRGRRIVYSEHCSRNCHLKLFKNSHALTEAVLQIYETSNNLSLFEKYQKQMKFQAPAVTVATAKEKQHRLSKIVEVENNSSAKNRKLSQNSAYSQKIHFINNILKKNVYKSVINQNINNLNADKVRANNLRKELNRMNEKIPTIGYVYNQVHFLNHVPLIILCKSALIIHDDLFLDIIKIAWSLLLNSDQEISSSAGKEIIFFCFSNLILKTI